jgi:hypothetical protein
MPCEFLMTDQQCSFIWTRYVSIRLVPTVQGRISVSDWVVNQFLRKFLVRPETMPENLFFPQDRRIREKFSSEGGCRRGFGLFFGCFRAGWLIAMSSQPWKPPVENGGSARPSARWPKLVQRAVVLAGV